MVLETGSLVEFLVEAKRNTYASQGDDSSVPPLFEGSKQLEYAAGPFMYRDVYFGSARFSGQEVVCFSGDPVWSMVYSGGVVDSEDDLIPETYAFLRRALAAVTEECPFRGPRLYVAGQFGYFNEAFGNAEEFWGQERIEKNGREVYQLRYSGGRLR